MSLPYRNKMSRNGRNRKVSVFAASSSVLHYLTLKLQEVVLKKFNLVVKSSQAVPNCDEQKCIKQLLGCTDTFGAGLVSDRGAVPLRGYIGRASLMVRA